MSDKLGKLDQNLGGVDRDITNSNVASDTVSGVKTLNPKLIMAVVGGISGVFFLAMMFNSMGAQTKREEAIKAKEQKKKERETALVDREDAAREARRKLDLKERMKEEQERRKNQKFEEPEDPRERALTPEQKEALKEQQDQKEPIILPDASEREALLEEDKPDPWEQARAQYRAQRAQIYYQEMASARRAPIFFGAGTPGRGASSDDARDHASAPVTRGARSEREFLAHINASSARARQRGHGQQPGHVTARRDGWPQLERPAPNPGSVRERDAFLLRHRSGRQGSSSPPPSGDYVEAGTLIHAVLETGIDSELPGQVIARVAQPVWDRNMAHIVVPAGAKILGVYNARVEQGQTRVQVVWNRLIMPTGRAYDLGGLPGTSLSGQSGFEAKVDEHWDRVVAGAAVSATFSAASSALAAPAQALTGDARGQAIRGGGGSLQKTGEDISRRYLEVAPTLRVSPGERVGMLVMKDLVL